MFENRLVEITADGSFGRPMKVPLKRPLKVFFTATPRSGSAPTMTIDLLGEIGRSMRYARVRLRSPKE